MNFHVSLVRVALLVSLFALVAWGGVSLAIVPNTAARIAGVAVALVGAICVVGFSLPLFRSGVQVCFGQTGIEDQRRHYGVIEWTDIRQVHVRGFATLVIEVTDPQKYLDRAPEQERVMESIDERVLGGALNIDFHTLTPGAGAACKYISKHHPDVLVGRGPSRE